ncbi:MAG: hypothetical protein Q9174_005210 [Haloplaca sp. 1 TL-2023]
MNWTGGSLSRSRKQNANLSVIQKKHFAKVRGALLNGRQPPPRLDLAFFEEVEQDIAPHIAGPAHHLRGTGHRTQHTLDEYDQVRPVINQLSSLKPRSRLRTPGPPRVTGERHSKYSPQHYGRAPSSQKRRTPLDSVSTRQHVSASSSVAHNPMKQAPLDKLEAKRQELLTSSDWVGLQQLKPVNMKFADAEDRDLIGKRRRLEQSHHCLRRQDSQHRRPLVNPYEKLRMLQAKSNMGSSPEKISVHIGSSDKGSVGRRTNRSVGEGQSSSPGIMLEDMLRDDESSHTALMREPIPNQGPFRQSSSSTGFVRLDDGNMKSPLSQDAAAFEALNPFSYQGFNAVDNATILGDVYAISSRAESVEDEEAPSREEEFDERAPTASARAVNDQYADTPNKADNRIHNAFQVQRSQDEHIALPVKQMLYNVPSAHTTEKGPEDLPPAANPTDLEVNDDSDHEALHADDTFAPLEGYEEQRTAPVDEPQRLVEPGSPLPAFKAFKNAPTAVEPKPPASDSAGARPSSSPKAPNIKEHHATAPSPSPAPDDDEALWRTFVFGSSPLANDPIITFNPDPKPKPIPTQSSSPLLPADTRVSPHSSPPQQAQPSPVIAEASSSPIHPPSRNFPKETTSAGAENDSSPIRTQHSTTAQASLSSDEFAKGSSSPRRQQPTVVFAKPKPFVGEKSGASAVPLLRIGGVDGRRRRGADGRFLKLGKENRGGSGEVMGDEIVD